MTKKLKFLDIYGNTHSVIALDVEKFSHDVNLETGEQCTAVEIDGKIIMANYRLLDFTMVWNAAISSKTT